MPADPTKLYRHLPDCYDRSSTSNQYKLMAALEAGVSRTRTEVETFRDEITITGASGDGLTRRVLSKGLFRPPGMSDTTLRTIAKAIYGASRGTLAAIKAVAEAATGLTLNVNDKQTVSSIPSWEIWIEPASGVWPSYGRSMYPDINTETFYVAPLRSSLAGPVIDALGQRGAFINDHAWYPVDLWTMSLLNKVRPAGTKIVFKGV